MNTLGKFVYLVYTSMFLTGERGVKGVSPYVRVLLAVALASMYVAGGLFVPSSLALMGLIGSIGYGPAWFISVVTLTSIPSLWLAATAYALSLLGFIQPLTILDATWIYLRSLTLGSMMVFFFNLINLREVYNLLVKTRLNKVAVAPLLIWRIIPYGLLNVAESLSLTKVKGEKLLKRLPPALASLIELGDLFKEASYYKIASTPKKRIP